MIEADKKAIYTKELWDRWHDARKEWEDHAREDIDFYLGNHFSENESDELESRNQSNIPLDRLYSAIEQFKAIITSKPPKFSAIPREDSDSDLASVWKTILEYIWNISDGNEVLNKLYMIMLLLVLVTSMRMLTEKQIMVEVKLSLHMSTHLEL